MIFGRETSDPRLIPDILPIVHLGLDQVICIPRRRLARVKESVSEPMKKVVIIGAAGRDFHNFNIIYRNNPEYHVVADRKSTRLNSSHLGISYAVFCLKKKK